jgi:hypothetical protein
MKKVAFGAEQVSGDVVGFVSDMAKAAGAGNTAWILLGHAAGKRPDGVTLAAFAAAVVERCEKEGVVAPGLNIGYISKAAKVATVLMPMGVCNDSMVIRSSQRVLYMMARAVEEGKVSPAATLRDVWDYVMGGGEIDQKRKVDGKDDGKGDGKDDGKDDGKGDVSPEEAEVWKLIREGAAAAGLSLLEFTKKAVAAALAS